MSESLPKINPAEKTLNQPLGLDRLTEVEQQIYQLMVPEYNKERIDMDEFSDLYNPEVIKKDTRYVAEREAQFRQKETQESEFAQFNRRAEILEAILAEQIELSNWFGQEAEAIPASRLDDIANGVDMIAEFLSDEGFKHLALSIDVTSSVQGVKKKLAKIKENILAGKLSVVKYFKSDQANLRGELSNIPKVIIGMDNHTISELSYLLLQVRKLRGASEDNRTKLSRIQEQLANHRAQLLILNEIQMQLKTFKAFAQTHGQDRLAQEYETTLKTIESIKTDKESELVFGPSDREHNKSDAVYQSLQAALKEF